VNGSAGERSLIRETPDRHVWRRVWQAAPIVLVTLVATAAPALAQLQSARVRGIVVDSCGQPVAGAAVLLADPLGAVIQRAGTDSAGRFSFPDVAPGRFILRVESAAPGGTASLSLNVEAAPPIDVVLRLPPRVDESVQVEGRLEAASTRVSLAGESLAEVPVRIRGRSLQDAIATLPGWSTEDNGLLHTRGVDDGFLYVIDGVPVYERLDALNGVSPETASIGSINVVTGYVAPEFGYKAGGVIEVRSSTPRIRLVRRPRALRRAEHGRPAGRRPGSASARSERGAHRIVAARLVRSHGESVGGVRAARRRHARRQRP
jgi:hypothetical protein